MPNVNTIVSRAHEEFGKRIKRIKFDPNEPENAWPEKTSAAKESFAGTLYNHFKSHYPSDSRALALLMREVLALLTKAAESTAAERDSDASDSEATEPCERKAWLNTQWEKEDPWH